MSDLITDTCLTCGIEFAYPRAVYEKLTECHNTFYCPNGHKQYFSGKSDLEKTRAERDKYLKWYRSELKTTERLSRSNSALRGVITKLKGLRNETRH